MEYRTTVAKTGLMKALLTAKCRPDEPMADFGKRVRSINHDIRCATDGEAQQTDETLVHTILLGLPPHMEDWKSAFDGRGDREKSMECLLVDLKRQDEILHSESKPIPEKEELLIRVAKGEHMPQLPESLLIFILFLLILESSTITVIFITSLL